MDVATYLNYSPEMGTACLPMKNAMDQQFIFYFIFRLNLRAGVQAVSSYIIWLLSLKFQN
jgi:hypothetical protein